MDRHYPDDQLGESKPFTTVVRLADWENSLPGGRAVGLLPRPRMVAGLKLLNTLIDIQLAN